MNRVCLLVACGFGLGLGAAEPSATSDKADAKVDQIYRAYLVNLAKAYTAETAKLEAQLKREAANAKRDADLAAAITALQEKVKAGKQMDDFASVVSAGLLDPIKLAGDTEAAVVGRYDITTVRYFEQSLWAFDLRADHSMIEYLYTPTGKQTNTYRWALKNGKVLITLADSPLSLHTWNVDLPMPIDGTITLSDVFVGRGANVGQHTVTELSAKRRADPLPPVAGK